MTSRRPANPAPVPLEGYCQHFDALRWDGPEDPGAWVAVERCFRDGHSETWWVLEVAAGPYGPEKPQRVLVATTDPHSLPNLSTWWLITNLPAPGTQQAARRPLASAEASEIVRLYGLRQWVEQSYKQTKYALGWSDYQVRSDRAMRRHWALVCCAFSFCWYHQSRVSATLAPAEQPPTPVPAPPSAVPASPAEAGRGENQQHAAGSAHLLVAAGPAGGASLAGALDHALALLARLVDRTATAPTTRVA